MGWATHVVLEGVWDPEFSSGSVLHSSEDDREVISGGAGSVKGRTGPEVADPRRGQAERPAA